MHEMLILDSRKLALECRVSSTDINEMQKPGYYQLLQVIHVVDFLITDITCYHTSEIRAKLWKCIQ